MIYLFLGNEQFLKSRALALLKAKACAGASSYLNYREFSVEEAGQDDFKNLLDDARTAPFMSKHRLFVIRGVNDLSEAQKDELGLFMENKPKSTVLALVAGELKKEDIIYRAVMKCGKIMNFDAFSKDKLNRWINERFAQLKKRIEPAALKLLIDNVGVDLTQLDLTVELVAAFTGKRDNVVVADIEKLTGKNLEVTAFALTDAIGAKNANAAFKVLNAMEKDAGVVPQLVGLLGWQLRRIWSSKKSGNSFLRQGDRFSTKELEQGFKLLLELDKDIKSSPVESWRAFELLVARLCS